MTRSLLSIAALAGCLSFSPLYAGSVDHGDRDFYGFFLSNMSYTNVDESAVGFTKQTFNALDENEMFHQIGVNQGVYAATAIDGIYYVIPYLYASSLSQPTPLPMYTYNIYTGRKEEVGQWNPEGSDLKIQDMTYDRANDRLLAIAFQPQTGSVLYEIDRKTAQMTPIVTIKGTAQSGVGVIAADAKGRLFTIDNDGWFCQLNDKTGNITKLFDTGHQGFVANQSLEFDFSRGNTTLYWAASIARWTTAPTSAEVTSKYGTTWLEEIVIPNKTSGNFTPESLGRDKYTINDIGEIGYVSRFTGLYIPFAQGGISAPGDVTDFTVKNTADGKGAILNFKVPTKTFGGEALSSVNGLEIFRDGERIEYMTGITPGQAIEYTDNAVPAIGEYHYEVWVFNGNGEGPKTHAYAYIGADKPAAVADADIDVADDFMSTKLSWQAPTEGYHGGSFKPEGLTYTITRFPDELVIAENTPETSVTDKNFRRMLRYYYQIDVTNAQGTSTSYTTDFIAGGVLNAPVTETFDDVTAMNNKWSSFDNNNDTYRWEFGISLGHNLFGDYEQCADYVVSSTMVDGNLRDADDWIISPGIKFEEGKKYAVHVEARAYPAIETLNVYTGSKIDPAQMTKVGSFRTELTEQDQTTGSMAFKTYTVSLPDVAGKIACVAVQLASPIPADLTSYIQINSITIGEDDGTGIAGVTGDNTSFNFDGNILTINGNFAGAAIYNMAGMKVADITSATTDLSGLQSGIYVLALDGSSFKLAK